MKKCIPAYGQNSQLIQWWMLVHCGPTTSHVTTSSTFAVVMEETWHSNQHVQLPDEKSSK